ncbi:MAG: hypothetical protein HC936_12975 [Leptolyngbyaceae cyanobacterium SU_3_3]|nr:hypothetical protein [Leptolyngbyaceae cyanobacterium SU_3_3]
MIFAQADGGRLKDCDRAPYFSDRFHPISAIHIDGTPWLNSNFSSYLNSLI